MPIHLLIAVVLFYLCLFMGSYFLYRDYQLSAFGPWLYKGPMLRSFLFVLITLVLLPILNPVTNDRLLLLTFLTIFLGIIGIIEYQISFRFIRQHLLIESNIPVIYAAINCITIISGVVFAAGLWAQLVRFTLKLSPQVISLPNTSPSLLEGIVAYIQGVYTNSYTISFSLIIVIILLPLISGIAAQVIGQLISDRLSQALSLSSSPRNWIIIVSGLLFVVITISCLLLMMALWINPSVVSSSFQ